MIYPPVTRLIECDFQTDIKPKYIDFVDGGNGCFYGIPHHENRVLLFNVEDKTVKEIGPDLGLGAWKYRNGIKANNGSIYCFPDFATYLLKITPEEQDAKVQILEDDLIPWSDDDYDYKWIEGVLAKDGCIYYFPDGDGPILKLNPNSGDNLSLVGEEIDDSFGAVILGDDEYIYGISDEHIFKFDPKYCTLSNVGRDMDEYHLFEGAVKGNDGNIYSMNRYGQILNVDIVKNDWEIIGHRFYNGDGRGWGRPVLGADKCIYFPPACHDQVLKFNPSTKSISLIGEYFTDREYKWMSGTLASDGFIYCIPMNADNILQIDSRHVNEQILESIKNFYAGH